MIKLVDGAVFQSSRNDIPHGQSDAEGPHDTERLDSKTAQEFNTVNVNWWTTEKKSNFTHKIINSKEFRNEIVGYEHSVH